MTTGRILLSRRRVLSGALRVAGAAAVSAPLGACRSLAGADPEPGAVVRPATGTPTPGQTAVPTAALPAVATPLATRPPVVALEPRELGQGESAILSVRQESAASGSARLLGQQLPLIRSGDVLWAPVAAGLLTAVGPATVEVVTRASSGEVLAEVTLPFTVVSVDRPVDYLTASPSVTAVLTVEAAETEAALRTYEQFNLFEARPRWNGTLLQPCEGIMTTAFGQGRSINGGPVTGQHSGTDIANAEGTPIVSAAAGRVAWAGAMPIRGNSVLVDHGAGVVTGYHHLLESNVAVGQLVEAGKAIAKMGSTGFSTGPHLHWEMTIYGVNVDPMTWTERVFRPTA